MKLRPPKVRLFDLETNGLLPHQVKPGSGKSVVTTVHSLVIQDYESNSIRIFRKNKHEDNIADGLKMLSESDLIVGHNVIGYDIPALAKLYGFSFPRKGVLDTLVMSRLIYANIKDKDMALMRSGKLPGRLFGSQGLEAWGYRTGEFKDEYIGDPSIEDPDERKRLMWSEWNQTMEDYCVQDVKATRKVFDLLVNDPYYFPEGSMEGIPAIRLEHDIKWTMCQQERNGFPFGERQAEKLYVELAGQRQVLLDKLLDTFDCWWQAKGGTSPFMHPRTGMPLKKYPMVVYPKTGDLLTKAGKLAKTDYFKDAPYTPVTLIQFNPSSRDHIAKVLQDNGWVPTEFTETGKPVVDEESLATIKVDDPKAQAAVSLIAEYMLLVKRIGQIAEGENGWLRWVRDGLVHGSINPNGAVTGRATHSSPNVAQVPSNGALWGVECRDLWGAKHYRHVWPEAIQMGTDASGLELRCLGHFMARFDDGAYIDVLLNGDIHWLNVQSLGLVPAGTTRDKSSTVHDGFRDNAKTFIYAFLYGAGDEKIGTITNGGKKEGKALKDLFMKATPAIAALRDSIKETLVASESWVGGQAQVKWKRNWLKGLDGRKLHVRSSHSALNTLLQSAGALACKLWAVEFEARLMALGYKHGNTKDDDFMICAWVHDELQVICRNREIAEVAARVSAEAMEYAGDFFKFRCKLAAEAKFGDSWKDCH